MKNSLDKEFVLRSLQKVEELLQLYEKLKEAKLLSMALHHLVQAHKKIFKNTLGISNVTFTHAKEFAQKYSREVLPRQLQSFIDVAQLWEKYTLATTKFSRKGALVVCDDDFVMHALTSEDLHIWCYHTKKVVTTLFEATKQ